MQTTILRTEKEREVLRESGRRLSLALDAVEKAIIPGVSTAELDRIAEEVIRGRGDVPSFLGYTPAGADRPFPAALCVSVNDEIVHGIPSVDRILQQGDIVGIDLGATHQGITTDSARTVGVGTIDPKTKTLLETTQAALDQGIGAVCVGGSIGDIGFAIESFVKPFGFGIVREMGGHGVGRHIHEEPYIANFGKRGTGPKIEEGMVLAIEPMLTMGNRFITMDQDGYTIRTADGSKSAHFEHTILVTADGAEIITSR